MTRNNADFGIGREEQGSPIGDFHYGFYHNPRTVDFPFHVYATHKDAPYGETVGNLFWDKTGEVKEVYVKPEHRRRGVGTMMYNLGKQIAAMADGVPQPRHSTTSRSEVGDLWAQSMPDYTPIAKNKIRKRYRGDRGLGGEWD